MSKVSKLLDELALRNAKARAEALFESVPVIAARRVLKAEPECDLTVVVGKETVVIPGKKHDGLQPDDVSVVETLLLDMQKRLKSALAAAPAVTPVLTLHTRKAPEAKSLYSQVKRRFVFKHRPVKEYRWEDDSIQKGR